MVEAFYSNLYVHVQVEAIAPVAEWL